MGTERAERNPNIGLSYEIEVYDKDGNLKEHREEEAHCFVENFFKMLLGYYVNGDMYSNFRKIPFTMTTGSTVSTYCETSGEKQAYYGGFRATEVPGSNAYGIVVGTSNTPVTPTDFSLGSIISHGVADGTLSYDASTLEYQEGESNVMILKLSRVFQNDGAVAVAINEIGLYQYTEDGPIMTIRDVVASPISLGVGELCAIAYKLQFN